MPNLATVTCSTCIHILISIYNITHLPPTQPSQPPHHYHSRSPLTTSIPTLTFIYTFIFIYTSTNIHIYTSYAAYYSPYIWYSTRSLPLFFVLSLASLFLLLLLLLLLLLFLLYLSRKYISVITTITHSLLYSFICASWVIHSLIYAIHSPTVFLYTWSALYMCFVIVIHQYTQHICHIHPNSVIQIRLKLVSQAETYL